jgi:indole-3-glycerol phosphate synthase
MQSGASALSVLTDSHFFGGKNADLTKARKFNFCPILRKDFVIDEYQLIEAKSIGADAVLLIAECLEKNELNHLASTAKSLGLEVLMEIHSIEQLTKLNENIDIVGVNNRNLEDFSVDINNSIGLSNAIPKEFLKISESGINDAERIVELQQAGFQGFLIGEYFMKTADPPKACADLINEVKTLRKMKKLVK